MMIKLYSLVMKCQYFHFESMHTRIINLTPNPPYTYTHKNNTHPSHPYMYQFVNCI